MGLDPVVKRVCGGPCQRINNGPLTEQGLMEGRDAEMAHVVGMSVVRHWHPAFFHGILLKSGQSVAFFSDRVGR